MNEKFVFIDNKNRIDAVVSERGPIFLQQIPEEELQLQETINVPRRFYDEVEYTDEDVTYQYTLERLFPQSIDPQILTIGTAKEAKVIIVADSHMLSFSDLEKSIRQALEILTQRSGIYFAQIPVIYDMSENLLLFGAGTTNEDLASEIDMDNFDGYSHLAPHGTMLAFHRYYSALYKNSSSEPYQPYGYNADFIANCRYFEIKMSSQGEIYINGTSEMLDPDAVAMLQVLRVKMGNEIIAYEGDDSLYTRFKMYIPKIRKGNSIQHHGIGEVYIQECLRQSVRYNSEVMTNQGNYLKVLPSVLGEMAVETEYILTEMEDTYSEKDGFPVAAMLLEKDNTYKILVGKTHQDTEIQKHIQYGYNPVAMLDCSLHFLFPPTTDNLLGIDIKVKTIKRYVKLEEYGIKKHFFTHKEFQTIQQILLNLSAEYQELSKEKIDPINPHKYPKLTVLI